MEVDHFLQERNAEYPQDFQLASENVEKKFHPTKDLIESMKLHPIENVADEATQNEGLQMEQLRPECLLLEGGKTYVVSNGKLIKAESSKTSESTDQASANGKRLGRTLRKCPCCSKKVSRLQRHLKIHGLAQDEIRELCRQKKKGSGTKFCPLPGCSSERGIVHFARHLRKKHKLTSNDAIYRKLVRCQEADVACDFLTAITDAYEMYLLAGDSADGSIARQRSIIAREALKVMALKDLLEIDSAEKLDIFKIWLQICCVKNGLGTAITYLAELISFVQYLVDRKKIEATRGQRFINMLNTWHTSFARLTHQTNVMKDVVLDVSDQVHGTLPRDNGHTTLDILQDSGTLAKRFLRTCILCRQRVGDLARHLQCHRLTNDQIVEVCTLNRPSRVEVNSHAHLHLKRQHSSTVDYEQYSAMITNEYEAYLGEVSNAHFRSLKIGEAIKAMKLTDIFDIDSSEKLALLEVWLRIYCQRNNVDSALAYLCELIYFVKYLIAKTLMASARGHALISKFIKWQNSFRKRSNFKPAEKNLQGEDLADTLVGRRGLESPESNLMQHTPANGVGDVVAWTDAASICGDSRGSSPNKDDALTLELIEELPSVEMCGNVPHAKPMDNEPESRSRKGLTACPCCSKEVTSLASHLKRHGLAKDEVRELCAEISKRTHGKTLCPLPDCSNNYRPIRLLDVHLVNYHKLRRSDPLFQQVVSQNKGFVARRNPNFAIFVTEQYEKYLLQALHSSAAREKSLKVLDILRAIQLTHIAHIDSSQTVDSLLKWFMDFCETGGVKIAQAYLIELIGFVEYLMAKEDISENKGHLIICMLKEWQKKFDAWSNLKVIDCSKKELVVGDTRGKGDVSVSSAGGVQSTSKDDSSASEIIEELPRIELTDTASTDVAVYEDELEHMARRRLRSHRRGHSSAKHVNQGINKQTMACPLPGCGTFESFAFLEKHLRTYHKLDCSHEVYREILQSKAHQCSIDECENFTVIITIEYEMYLLSLDGGNQRIERAHQTSLKVRQVLKAMELTDVFNIDSPDHWQLLEKWFEKNCRNNSAIIYLSEMTGFFKFLVAKKGIATNRAHLLINNIIKWKKSFRNESNVVPIATILNSTAHTQPNSSSKSTEAEGSTWEQTNAQHVSQKGRKFYSDYERFVLKEAFAEFINEAVVPSNKQIRQVLNHSEELSKWAAEKLQLVKVRGCLQNFKNKFLRATMK